MSVTIPDGHPDLNLAAWLDWRREQIGPWSDYIIREVGNLEHEIANLRSVAPCWKPIDTAPSDTELLLGWRDQTFGDGLWRMVVDLAHSTRGGWWHGQATHWMPLPEPPTKDSTHD